MKRWLEFVSVGLILGLFTEVQFNLLARSNPRGFIVAVLVYPVILTLSYAAHRVIDRLISTGWKGDVLHYMAVGIGGLAVEWGLLGNGPGSNAIQIGMFAMWTTFCFGPRILTRDSPLIRRVRGRFWLVFGLVAILVTMLVALVSAPNAKLVLAVLVLSGANMVWSVWLLVLAWRTRRESAQ